MEAVVKQVPDHLKWADEFLAYVKSFQMDICEGVAERSLPNLGEL